MTCTGNCSYCKYGMFCSHPGVPRSRRTRRKRYPRRYVIFILLTILSMVVACAGISSASLRAGPTPFARLVPESATDRHERNISRVLSVLENRIGEGALPAKAKKRLQGMSDEELRLVTSLCDRIAVADNKDGADVALLLVTAMIVLT